MTAWIVTTNPTCTTAGKQTRTCQNNCNYSDTNPISILPHDREWIQTTPATCTSTAIESHRCRDCNDINATRIGAQMLNHIMSPWTITTPATCTTTGLQTRNCTMNCGTIEAVSIPMLEHTRTWTETRAATCTVDALESFRCTTCNNASCTRSGAPAHGHDMSDWIITSPATCTETGQRTRTCTHGCGHTEVDVISLGCDNLVCEICGEPAPPPPPPPTGNPNKGLDAKWIGIIIGAAVLILGIMVFILLTMIHKSRHERENTAHTNS